MSSADISQVEIEAIFPKVAEIVADALDYFSAYSAPITLDFALINDLGAESIDFLDIVFRLERTFKVKIPRGKIIEDARGSLTDAQFESGGILTEAGMSQLKAFLSEVPADRFTTPFKVAEIPKLFTVETFCKMVLRQQKAASHTASA